MYNVTTTMDEILKQSTRVIDVKAVINETEISSECISDFSIEYGISEDGILAIGGAVSAKLSITFIKDASLPTYWTTQPITMYVAICNQKGVTNPEQATDYTWFPMGTFYIDNPSIKKTELSISFDAFDKMKFLEDIVYETALTYPKGRNNVLNELATNYNITLATVTIDADIINEPLKGTVREVIQQIAQKMGANAYFNRNNELEFIAPSAPIIITKQPEDAYSIEGEEIAFEVEAIGNNLSYQWQLQRAGNNTWSNSTSSGNNTSRMYTTFKNSYADGCIYRCLITDASGNQTVTQSAKIYANTGSSDFAIVKQPKDAFAQDGKKAYFYITVQGTNPTYQWQRQSSNGTSWIDLDGYTTDTLTVNVSKVLSNRVYRCVVTNEDGTVLYSETAKLNFQPSIFYMDAENYETLTLEGDEATKITKLCATIEATEETEAQTLSYGVDGGVSYTVTNPNITTDADLETIYNRCFPIVYDAYNISMQGMPHLDCGDLIYLTTVKGETYLLPIVNHTLSFAGGLKSEIEAKAVAEEGASASGSTGSITGNIAILKTDVIETQKLLATTIEADNAKFNNLEATKADINLANIEAGCITSAMIGEGVVGTAQIADGSITDAKIVGLTANKITAGKIDASNIEVVNLNASNITVGTINGQQIASGTITVDNLDEDVAGAVQDAKDAIKGLNDLTIGGVNLLSNSKGDNATDWYLSASNGGVVEDSEMEYCFEINVTSIQRYMNSPRIKLKPNTEYTFSFDIWFNDNVGTYSVYVLSDTVDTPYENATSYVNADRFTYLTIPSVRNEWVREKYTFTTRADMNSVIFRWNNNAITETEGITSTMRICRVKVEQGNKATDWTVNPSETEYAITKAQYTADNIQVGGVNMLIGSHLDEEAVPSPRNYSMPTLNTVTTEYTTEGIHIMSTTAGTHNNSRGIRINTEDFGLADGDEVTLSMDIKGRAGYYSTTNASPRGIMGYSHPSTTNTNWYGNMIRGTDFSGLINEDTYTRVASTFTIKTDYPEGATPYAYFNIHIGLEGEIWYKNVKLEKGNKATDWTQNPQEITDRIQSNTDVLVEWCKDNDLTYIDGAKIYTGTIFSDAIASNAIVSDKIASDAITSTHIKAHEINANHIQSESIGTDCIASRAIQADKIDVDAIGAEHISADAVTTDAIVAEAITSEKIATEAILANHIASETITGDKLVANTITSNEIDVDDLFAQNITATGTITGATIEGASGNFTKSFNVNITDTEETYRNNFLASEGGIYIGNSWESTTDGTWKSSNILLGSNLEINATNNIRIYSGVSADTAITFSSANTKDIVYMGQSGVGIRVPLSTQDITANGIDIVNEKIVSETLLYPNASQRVNLSLNPISAQHKGIVLVFFGWSNNQAINSYVQTYFIPKELIRVNGSTNIVVPLLNWYTASSSEPQWCRKCLTVTDTSITGLDMNSIAPNNRFVLRYVIGV